MFYIKQGLKFSKTDVLVDFYLILLSIFDSGTLIIKKIQAFLVGSCSLKGFSYRNRSHFSVNISRFYINDDIKNYKNVNSFYSKCWLLLGFILLLNQFF